MNFKAYYDPATDEIYNCKKYSYIWFHERRHQIQFKTIPKLKSFNHWLHILTYGLNAGVLATIIFQLKGFMLGLLTIGFISLPYTAFNLYLEADALIVGSWYWIQHKRKGLRF